MKSLFSLVLTCFTLSALAQEKADSVKQKLPSDLDKVNVYSPEAKLPALPDTLLRSYQKVNSIRDQFNAEADSIRNQYQAFITRSDNVTNKLKHSIDSLQNLNLPAGKYTQKLDSINQVRQKTEVDFNTKASALKARTTDKLNGLDLPPQYNEPLQQITGKVDGFDLQSDFVKIPQVDVPGYSLPEMDGLGDFASRVGDPGSITEIGKTDALLKIETPVGDLGQITEQAKGYQEDLKNISNGNLDDVQQIPKAIEDQAAKIDGVSELQKQSGVIADYKNQIDNLNDPAKAKEQVAAMAKNIAIDHFAGKQEQLKAAMDKMSTYKQKYSSVSSIKNLPRRAPNAMKGKPLIERLVPGLFFQYQQKNYNLFDANPYLGYRLSGRFTSGAGWNQRYAYDRKKDNWNSRARIFGPRVYVDFKMGKGFIAHLESELMKAFVPFTISGNPEAGQRDWVFGMMTGMKKEYKIYKNLKGTALIQYNLFNPEYKAPYVDRLNSRIGFEYALKRRAKAKK